MLEFTSVLTSDDVRLNVVQTGNPHGPAIVFIHGISQSWMSWIAQLTDWRSLRSSPRPGKLATWRREAVRVVCLAD